MTDNAHEPPQDDEMDRPLDPWIVALAREVTDDIAVPREMMWKRIEAKRSTAKLPRRMSASFWRGVSAIAAVLVVGVAIGRYAWPSASDTRRDSVSTTIATIATPTTAATSALGPDALAAAPVSSDPIRVAMDEHLIRTVALLTTVRDRDPDLGPGLDVTGWARDLLATTRLLLDEPTLRDERTRRLLQDLELVMMQIIQTRRNGAEDARRVATETMRDTNLLPRVRAVVTAAAVREELSVHGGLE